MQSPRSAISHTAVVTYVDAAASQVHLKADAPEGGCASCAAASFCGASKGEEIVLQIPEGISLSAGDRVMLEADSYANTKTVLLMIIFPLAALLLTFLVLSMFGSGEPLAAIGGISVMLLFYLLLYLRFKRNPPRGVLAIKPANGDHAL